MAKLTTAQREDVRAYAIGLIRSGYSRRQAEAATRSYSTRRYGVEAVLGHELASKTYQGRPTVPEVKPKRAAVAPTRRMKSTLLNPHFSRRPRTQREKFYQQLRGAGFNRRESNEFAKYWRGYSPPGGGRKQLVPFIKAMMEDRLALKQATLLEAKSRGWSRRKANNEFRKQVNLVYIKIARWRAKSGMGNVSKPFVSKDVHGNPVERRINPWSLKEYTWLSLPDSDKWDTPRKQRSNKDYIPFDPAKRYREKPLRDDIAWLKKEIRRTGDRSGRLNAQLRTLQYNLNTGNF